MQTIKLVREVNDPGNRGPSRGMYALQQALREAQFPWLKIGNVLLKEEIPWIWNYKDAHVAAQFSEWQWKYIMGPNVIFQNSSEPGNGKYERLLLDSESCALQFTESAWYETLIRNNCDRNTAPIVLWTYPISPQPDGPLDAQYDVLIYLKDMRLGKSAIVAQSLWPRHAMFIYGKYNREAMIHCARRSRACLYLSSDDRGPLALAEIMLAGCPAAGVPCGAPWIEHGISGIMNSHWANLHNDAAQAMSLDRNSVREWALKRFGTAKTVDTIRAALEPIAMGGGL